MSETLEDPIVAYRRLVEWRIVMFAYEIGTTIPSEEALDRLEAALLQEQEAIAYRDNGRGCPEIVCLIAMLEAEKGRMGPEGGMFSEENDYDRRLYEIFLRRMVQRHRATVQGWIDSATNPDQLSLEAALLYGAINYASSKSMGIVDRIIKNFRWWEEIEDSGAAPPRWILWDHAPIEKAEEGHQHVTATQLIEGVTTTLTLEAVAQPDRKLQITARLSDFKNAQFRLQLIVELEGLVGREHVRPLVPGKTHHGSILGDRLLELRVWSRQGPKP